MKCVGAYSLVVIRILQRQKITYTSGCFFSSRVVIFVRCSLCTVDKTHKKLLKAENKTLKLFSAKPRLFQPA